MTAPSTQLLRFTLVIALGLTAALASSCASDDPVAPKLVVMSVSDDAPVTAKRGSMYPDVIPLPDGFRPEGIVVGRGTTFYVGSLADGSIYRGDLRTGEGEILVTPSEDRVAVGLAYDQRTNRLFVAGQNSGKAYVYDAETGDEVASLQLTDAGQDTFINDVIVTRTAAYFTNSFQPEVYRVPLRANGQIADGQDVETLTFSGDYESVDGFNTNGIEATPNGDHLIVVNSSTGILYRVDPETGAAREIDLAGESVPAGDGLLLDGRTLYVVQNRLNQIAVVELAPDLTSGDLSRTISSEHFDVPTTVDDFGNDLYAVNARFGTEATPSTEYSVVRVPKK